MPRSIDIENMCWKEDSEYAAKEFGAGAKVTEGYNQFSRAFYDRDDGYRGAVNALGKFSWEMVIANDKDKQASAATEAKANEIFNWAQENLKGKWTLQENFGYRFTCAYAHYIIEDAADRKKFAAKWGDDFKYIEPTKKKRSRALTDFEAAQKERIEVSLKESFDASAKVLPLYKGLPEHWTFVSAVVEGDDKLFILPNDQLGDVTCLYGNTIEKNMVRQLATLLEGRDNFTAKAVFLDLVKDMLSGTGPDMFRAREVDGYRFSLVAKGSGENEEESYHGDKHRLNDFRQAYKEGWDLTFNFGGTSFTFNINNPLVRYRETEHSGIAVSDGYGHFTRGEYSEKVTGQYSRTTGLPEGAWERTTNVSGGTSYKGPQVSKAVYENGRLIEGSLGGDAHYQPAPPKITLLGQKAAAPK